MGEILQGDFGKRSKPAKSTLCKHGHHRWVTDKSSRFDVKQGKLVTLERCSRCGKTRQSLR
ncbi:MAG: hypothetical protein HKO71_08140 [Pseudomonadales bacterium]|nr:hypothetical protein [Gammaproteobacteria bacterium]NNL57709.1 hypothetical protein [Pseudomonadales bacterium]